ncbi:MAG: FixH family protein [Rickettsiales bacterium]|nr:FixH family protein [Rickettsiales bacterium]
MKKRLLAVFTAIIAVLSLVACRKNEEKKIVVNEQYSVRYVFVEKPKVGSTTLKINVFNQNNEKTSDLTVLVSYDMPSMRGHHTFKTSPITINKNRDYLLPVHFAMPGDWEIVLTFQQNGKSIHTEKILLTL